MAAAAQAAAAKTDARWRERAAMLERHAAERAAFEARRAVVSRALAEELAAARERCLDAVAAEPERKDAILRSCLDAADRRKAEVRAEREAEDSALRRRQREERRAWEVRP